MATSLLQQVQIAQSRSGTLQLATGCSFIVVMRNQYTLWHGLLTGSTLPRRMKIRRYRFGRCLQKISPRKEYCSPPTAPPTLCSQWHGPLMESTSLQLAPTRWSRYGNPPPEAPCAPIKVISLRLTPSPGRLAGHVSPRQVLTGQFKYGMPLPEKMPSVTPVIQTGYTPSPRRPADNTSPQEAVIEQCKYCWQCN